MVFVHIRFRRFKLFTTPFITFAKIRKLDFRYVFHNEAK
jgi:hypothetical protein